MSPTLHQVLEQHADANGTMSFRDYSQIALYDPDHGYYRQSRQRVGHSRQADFYTAASLGGVFAELLLNAISNLTDGDLGAHTLVELGAEPSGGAMAQYASHFSDYRPIGVADAMDIPERAVVFANELLDAQPFHRFIVSDGRWQERGVQLTENGLDDVLLPEANTEAAAFMRSLPERGEGYALDISLDAERLLTNIANQVGDGLLVFFDYGKSWQELIEACPAGTARAYFHHEASRELLANPGNQDLTCHVCWDRLEAVLGDAGIANTTLERQEAFFVKHAPQAIERIIMANDATMSREKQTLKELIYPGHMGHKFQVLSAKR